MYTPSFYVLCDWVVVTLINALQSSAHCLFLMHKTCCRVVILKKLHRVLESSSTLEPDDFYFQMIDPDPSYALTFDNLVKMLAIQMRFRYQYSVYLLVVTCSHVLVSISYVHRCGIPVVIMGETGCGKTRLVRYMCQLQARLSMDPSVPAFEPPQNFFIMKVRFKLSTELI